MQYKSSEIVKVTKTYPGGIKVSGHEVEVAGRRYFCQDAELCKRIVDYKEDKR